MTGCARIEAQPRNYWHETGVSAFDSLLGQCEEIVFYDYDIRLVDRYLPEMEYWALRTGNKRMQARCLYWQAYSSDELPLQTRIRLFDSALSLVNSYKDNYDYHRIRLSQSNFLKRQGNYLKAYTAAGEAEKYFLAKGDYMHAGKARVVLGVILYEIGEYANAVVALEEACDAFLQAGSLECATKNRINLCNALYLSGRSEESKSLLQELVFDSVTQKDTVFLVNVMVSMFRVSDSDNIYVDEALALARKLGDTELLLLTTMGKGADFLVRRENDSALFYYRQCLSYLGPNSNVVHSLPVYYAFSELFDRKGRPDSAYRYFRHYVRLKDSVLQQETLMQYRRDELYTAMEKARAEAESQRERNRLQRRIALGFGGFLLLVIGMALYILWLSGKKERISKMLKEAENRELCLQNEQIQSALDAKNRELISNTLLITEKNHALKELLEQVQTLLQAKKVPYPEGSQLVFRLKTLLKESNEWSFFRQHFENVHPEFFLRLKEACPQLSEHEMQICALIRIGVKNKEIAQIVGVNPNTVFTIRYRIRKKLSRADTMASCPMGEPESEASLENFLRKF